MLSCICPCLYHTECFVFKKQKWSNSVNELKCFCDSEALSSFFSINARV